MNSFAPVVEPLTPQEIRRVAEDVVDRRTKSMVSDALVMARWILENVRPKPESKE